MTITILQTILGGFIASIVCFIVGGVLYMNPFVAKIYQNSENSPLLKIWSSVPKYLEIQYVITLAQCLLWAFVFAVVKSALPEEFLTKVLVFGLILVAVKIFPRLFDKWIQFTYPNKFLVVEFVNGTNGSFKVGMLFSYFI